MTDSFKQQQVDLKAHIYEQSQKHMEEYKRDLEVAALTARTSNNDDKT